MLERYNQAINIACACLQGIPIMAVIFMVFPLRSKQLHRLPLFAVSCIVFGVVESVSFHQGHGFIPYFFATLVFLMLFVEALFDGWMLLKGMVCLLLLIYKCFLVPVADITAIYLLQEGTQPLAGMPHILSRILVALLLVPLAFFLIRFRVEMPDRRIPAWTALFLIFMICISLNLILLVLTVPDSVANVGYNICMIAVVSVCYYMIRQMIQSFYKELAYSVELEQLKCEKRYDEEIAEIYQDLKKLRHDLKNHILCMRLMLQQEEYQSLSCYCEELAENIFSANLHVDTGNLVANVILNQKYLHAMSQNIPVEISASLPEVLNIKKTDISALLSNLFDNALEASTRVEAPWIKIEIKPVKGYLSLAFSNKTEIREKNLLETRKENKKEHGLGLKIVEDIVERYNGMMDIQITGDAFLVNVLVKM